MNPGAVTQTRQHRMLTGKVRTRPAVRCLADVQSKSVDWLWQGRFPLGKVSLIYGDGGLGKSFLTLSMAATVTTGGHWPDGAPCRRGNVVLLNAEDDAGDTLVPRLKAMGAELSKIVTLDGVTETSHDGEQAKSVSLDRHVGALREVVEQLANCRLVVIDPISAFMGKADSHNNAEVRAVLSQLSDLAAELNVAVVVVSHVRKAEGNAVHRAVGSIAFVAAARAAWVVVRDKNDPRRRLFLPAKNNLGDDSRSSGLAFTIERPDPGRICWDTALVDITADEALAGDRQERGRPADGRLAAEAFLAEALAEGPRPRPDLIREASVRGISERTLCRAKTKLGIQDDRAIGGPSLWRLFPNVGER
jgi:putative DNA primase/helicase